MLLQNNSFLACNGLRYLSGAPAISGLLTKTLLGGGLATKANRYIGEAALYKGDAIPSGYAPTSGAWYPNAQTGGMSSRNFVAGAGAVDTAFLAGGLNGAVQITGAGAITTMPFLHFADHFIVDVASLISQGKVAETTAMRGACKIPATITGSGTIPDVPLKILAWCLSGLTGTGGASGPLILPVVLAAALAGIGDITFAALVGLVHLLGQVTGDGDINPGLRFPAILETSLTGQGTIPITLIKAIGWCVASILDRGEASGDLRGDSFMQAEITSQGDLVTPQSCAQAVWNAVAAAFNDPGTMGSKMNSASAAGDPWTAEIPGTYPDGSAGAILEKIKKLVNDNQALILAG